MANIKLINVPITKYSVLTSGLSFSLNLIILLAAINNPIDEYSFLSTSISIITRSIIPIHLPALARVSASSIFSRHFLVSCAINIAAGSVTKVAPVKAFQKKILYQL